MARGDTEFAVQVDPAQPLLLVASGELDATTAPQLADALGTAVASLEGTAVVELDLGEVSFIDSSGLQAITATMRELHGSGRELRVRRASRAVRRIFEVTGLHALLATAEAPSSDV
jgi:anti-anti-sigma factor